MAACCELLNVYATLGALAVSVVALVVYSTQEIPDGPHAAPVRALSGKMCWDLVLVLLLNACSAGAVCLSNFECPALMKLSVVHCLTTSSSLCVWSLLAWCSFLAQVSATTLGMVWFVMVDFLTFLCQADAQTLTKAQGLLYGLGNMTTAPQAAGFHPFAAKHIKDTPFISLKAVAKHLNVVNYCGSGNAPHLDSLLFHFWFACLLTVVSQALMAVALNGEKERVAVHEQHESEGLGHKLFGYT